MSIEKDILQRAFSSEHHKLRVNLLLTASWLSNEIKGFFERFGLTPKQYDILRILREFRGPVPPSVMDIREQMLDKMSDASRIIDRLEKKRLIKKKPCTMDKRATRIMIQQEGQDLMKQIDGHLGALEGVSASLSAEKIRQLNQLLEELRGE